MNWIDLDGELYNLNAYGRFWVESIAQDKSMLCGSTSAQDKSMLCGSTSTGHREVIAQGESKKMKELCNYIKYCLREDIRMGGSWED